MAGTKGMACEAQQLVAYQCGWVRRLQNTNCVMADPVLNIEDALVELFPLASEQWEWMSSGSP